VGRARRSVDVRLLAVAALIVLGCAAVGYRLFRVQGVEAATFVELGIEQRVRTEELAADRGTIFDRDLLELAVTVEGITVYANPQEIADPVTTARYVAPLVGGDPDVLAERFARDSSFVYVARQLDRAAAERVERAEIPGIYFVPEPKRVYPGGGLAANVLGFVRVDDNRGLEGLEYQFDEVLAGTPGRLVVERDPYGRIIPQGMNEIAPAEPGADIVLSIVHEIQFVAERALAGAIERTGAKAGTVVVLDPETGEVLAMASAPSFDPNDRTDADPDAFRNRAVTDTFEPGSTLKVVTIAAAIEEGAVEPEEVMTVPQEIEIYDKTYTDAEAHAGEMSVADVVAYSSNVGTILIEARIGNAVLHDYLAAFGLGQPTSGELPGEASGLLRPAEEWCATTCGPSTAIGYRVSVTALQMAGVYAALANDGIWVQPHLVREIIDGEGRRENMDPVHRTVVSADAAATMRRLLEGVVERGTGWRAAVEGYSVAGKTGTTEKFLPEEGAYSETDRIASFIGMAPVHDPKVVVAVMLDSPHGTAEDGGDYKFGGTSAAPVFAEVAEAALHQLGVSPDAG
jgi:cell division protein FtsI (penicillin-binding protein 3)